MHEKAFRSQPIARRREVPLAAISPSDANGRPRASDQEAVVSPVDYADRKSNGIRPLAKITRPCVKRNETTFTAAPPAGTVIGADSVAPAKAKLSTPG
jgi:hypothetical protein